MTDHDALDVRRRGRFGLVYAHALFAPGLTPLTRLVYAGLAAYADRDRQAFPTPARLATDLAVSRSTIYRALDELEAAGMLRRIRRTSEAGADRPTVLELHDEIPPDPSMGPLDADPEGVSHGGTLVSPTETGSVPQGDTRSVPRWDTNRRTREQNARAREVVTERAGGLELCADCHTLHDLDRESCRAAADRRRSSARAAADGRAAIRQAIP